MTLAVALQHRFADFALDVRFEAPAGVTVLFGRSGAGKTTVVRGVAGLLRPDGGRVVVDDWLLLDTAAGHSLPPHRRRLGAIFQEPRLFPHLSVRRNLGFGRFFAPRGAPGPAEHTVVEMLGLGPLLARRPATLSGGERQRVAIGRALLARPRLILADEPLAALDVARKAEILPYFERLRDETPVPILYVTHAPEEVAQLATTVVALQAGRVAAVGPAASVLADPSVTPAGVRAAGALIEARLVAQDPDGLTALDAGGVRLFVPHVRAPVGARLRLRIAAHDVILARAAPTGLSALNVLPGRITRIRPGAGPGALVALATPAGALLARVTHRSVQALELAEGVDCHAILKAVAVAPEDVGGAGATLGDAGDRLDPTRESAQKGPCPGL